LQVTGNIHLIPGSGSLLGPRSSNVYLIVSERLTVVDTGMPHNARKIIDYVKYLGREPVDIDLVILTHWHIDHSGSAAKLKRMSGARVAIHRDDAPYIAGKRKFEMSTFFASLSLRILARLSGFRYVVPDVLLKGGDKLDIAGGLEVLHIPGHTPGSICLYQPGRLLFSGDALRDRQEGGLPDLSDCFPHREEMAEEVKKTFKLDFKVLLPGHGNPIRAFS